MKKKVLTLCIVHKGSQVLLGMKQRGFGQGYWNGFGGKVEGGESIEEAAQREVKEEAGLTVQQMHTCGVLTFELPDHSYLLEVHVFRVVDFHGTPRRTVEMTPRWFSGDEIPYSSMWADDQHWLPLVLAGKTVTGHFVFRDERTLSSYYVQEGVRDFRTWHEQDQVLPRLLPYPTASRNAPGAWAGDPRRVTRLA